MTAHFLYNEDPIQDVIHALGFIDSFTSSMKIIDVSIDPNIVERVVKSCRIDFPHTGGVEQASVFKQVANFVCHFVAERPLADPFPSQIIGAELSAIENHQNAMLAFALGCEALNGSKIQRIDGEFNITNPISISKHSYIDIIDALSMITASTHFKLVTVLFEQLVYKSNPDCQYNIPQ